MTKKEIIDKLESIEKEVKDIKEYLSKENSAMATSEDTKLPGDTNFTLDYTLEDLYKEFGSKKSLAHRLSTALQRRNINNFARFFVS